MRSEADYQAGLIERIQELLPKCIILKNDCNYKQGIPDLSVFYGSKWAWLEVKKSMIEPHQPNQDYYVGYGNAISFASFIYPENESVVLKQLYDYFTK